MTPVRLHPLLLAFAMAMAIVLVAPTVIVVIMSFSAGRLLTFPPQGLSLHWYANFLAADTWTRAIATSTEVGIATAVVSAVAGTLMALGLVRGHMRAAQILHGLVLGPMVVPPVVLAIGLYFMFVRWHLVGTFAGMVAAHTALALPYVVVVTSSSLRNFDRTLELAANSLGAGPTRTFLRVTLPLILPSVAAGCLFAFIISWDELIVAYFLSTPMVRTLPVVMWSAAQDSTDPTLAAVATFLSVITVLLLLSSHAIRRKATGLWPAR
jgi:putative spermidine/putrescine transport system permease protein